MISSHQYCSHCGAANEADRGTCFACQQPLASDSASPAPLQGRYELLTCVGTGGYGAVYRARDRQELYHNIALKQINLASLPAQDQIEATSTFNREVELLSTLSNPHLPRVYDQFTDPEHWYVVMDFIEGETLESYCQKQAATSSQPGLPLETVLDIGLQLCDVLQYLHTRQPPVIFRDLKPGNIMRTPYGHLYLIDFGIARRFTPGKQRDTIPLGSPGYAAPEQYGKAQTTPQADLYSLGALLYFLLTGDDPADHPLQFAESAGYASSGERELRALIAHLVELLPTYRPASARDVQQELRQIILQQLPAHSFLRLRIEPPRIPTPTATSWYTPGGQQQQQQLQQQASSTISRRKVLTRIGIGALALGTGSIGWNIWQQANRHNDTLRTLNGYPGRVNALTWSPNNRYIASGTHDQSLYIHRIRTYRGRVRAETTGVWEGSNTLSFNRYGDYSPIASLSWSPEGDRLAVIRQGDLITLTPYGEQLSNLDIASGRTRMTPTLVAWSPYDTNFIATAGNTREAAIWDLTTGEQSYTSHYHTSFISAIACSPHTKEIASGDTNGYIMLWSMSGDAMVRIYDRHRTSASAAILALTWSPGGHYIASAAQGQAVHVWRTSDLQHRLIYTGHTGDVNALAWSPGGHYIASASDDGTVQVWVALSGKHFYTYSGHDGPVRSVTWSPDGRYIASGGDDKTVQIWQPE